LAALFF